jgi:hypothetical protein
MRQKVLIGTKCKPGDCSEGYKAEHTALGYSPSMLGKVQATCIFKASGSPKHEEMPKQGYKHCDIF